MVMEKGMQRWLVDISEWNPSPSLFFSVVSALPHHEHSSIIRYVKMEDRKRALVSRLLQHALVSEIFGISFDEIVFKRTAEGKPYLDCRELCLKFPNFNFNVSHHGDYVAIASEPFCLVGLDIVSLVVPTKESVLNFVQNFSSYFSSSEWHFITKDGSSDEVLVKFYRYWCLKEAFAKAIGTGLAYRLDKVEFHHTNWTNISFKIDGEEIKDWRFCIAELGKGHLVGIARGHPKFATESYKKASKRTEFVEEECDMGFQFPNVNFRIRTVEQLLATSHKAKLICATES